jgi:hypothetical protein
MKNYIYIGENYHITGKQLPQDCTIGITNNLSQTEISFNATKMATKYRIVKAWEVPQNMILENLEKIISDRFSIHKYDGTNWYDIDPKEVYTEITNLFNDLRIATNGEYSLIEIDIKKEEIYTEINTIRADRSDLDIKIDNVIIGGKTAKDKYTNFFRYIIEKNKVDPNILCRDFGKMLKKDKKELIGRITKQSSFIHGYYLECYNGTVLKKKNIDKINKRYGLGVICNVVKPNQ